MLEELSMQLEEAQERLPVLEDERKQAQQQVNQDAAELAQLEARLLALKQLQEKVQTQGKVQPWLEKHELGRLPKLWQKLHIEAGWETALESVLRERTASLEMSNLDWAKAFFNDAPPAKLAVYSPQILADQPLAAPGLKPFISLLQLNDAGIRSLMQDWLHQVYVAEDVASAFIDRVKLPPGASFITKQGHVISRSSVRFYASDSEQDGVLGRQQEIDNISKQCRARQLLADERKRARFALNLCIARRHSSCRNYVSALAH
jgi:chromosome segregation protein